MFIWFAVLGVALLLLTDASSWSGSVLRVGVALAVGCGAYFAAAVVLRQHELRWLLARSAR